MLLTETQLQELLNPKLYIGRAPEQVVEFIYEEVKPLLSEYKNLSKKVELNV